MDWARVCCQEWKSWAIRGVLCAAALAIAGCATNPTKECYADGELYYCEASKECGGLQRLCVEPGGCGNGLTEGTEGCDDGNVRSGDGCSPTCVPEGCGNKIEDPGEVCDDGDDDDANGCNNACTSRNLCGNGLRDLPVGEQCDDSNTASGDGCGPTCRFELCGNGTDDPGEECDDGNLVAGDRCSPTCFTERCGNGRPDPGEKCDDGNLDNNDECTVDCTSDNRCGNFIIDRNKGEVCDEGGVETPDCTADCFSQRLCGDGEVDTGNGEECDDGQELNQDNRDCRSDCTLNRCGDSFANTLGTHHEDCDGGPVPPIDNKRAATPTETATCNSDCTTAACNDRRVNRTAGEQCDDGAGNNADDRDCTAGCQVNRCGDQLPNTTGPAHREACDDGNRTDGDACTNQCTLPRCGDGVIEGVEQCDDGNERSDDGCSQACRFELCGDGIKNGTETCDRADPALPIGTCNLDCTLSRCGDRKVNLEAGERCDDGNEASNDGCSAACLVESCGDGVVNGAEACDVAIDRALCNLDCTLSQCGDGQLNTSAVPPEQCDDGDTDPGDGCGPSCRLEHCGNGVIDEPEECDQAAGPQPCSPTCHQQICGNGILDVDPGANPPIAETCDLGPDLNTDDGACLSTCRLARCGDGEIQVGVERCDDAGDNNDEADCTSTCQLGFCGDGLVNSLGSRLEACDDGDDNTDDPTCPYNQSCEASCSTACLVLQPIIPTCGDGVIHGPELCDDHNALACGSCDATCAQVTAQRAVGFIITVSGAQLDTDETVTLDDGVNPPVILTFVEAAGADRPLPEVIPGAAGEPVVVTVPFFNTDFQPAMQLNIRDSIDAAHAAGVLLIQVDAIDPVAMRLIHDRPTTRGNRPITEDVGAPTFFVVGMVTGAGGDCATGDGCRTDDDCASHACTANVCVP